MNYFYFCAFEKTSDLYSCLHKITSSYEIIECGQLHRGFFTLLMKTSETLSRPAGCVDFFETQKDVTTLLEAYYKQRSFEITHGLLVLECQNLSTLFSFLTTNSLISIDQLLEISRSALPNGQALALFVNIDSVDLQKLPAEIRGTYFQKPGSALFSLFRNFP
ncbi:hypothetical protein K2X05_05205 [bacterium]|nr:hypothetical protein [bacterium]